MAHPFVELMRRYCVDYTASHDFGVCDEIMVADYTLNMGGHVVAGRDDAYKPAAAAQFRQFPGLGITVNEVICSGDRLALRFSEHGASLRHDGALAAWSGVGLYHWNGAALVANYVEQDYFARRRQLTDRIPDRVESPAVAPWDTVVQPPNEVVEAAARRWLAKGDFLSVPEMAIDDSMAGHPKGPVLQVDQVELDDLFSAGNAVAFHGVLWGVVAVGDPDFRAHRGRPSYLHVGGVLHIADDQVLSGHIVRDRLGLAKRLDRDSGGGRGPCARMS